MTIKKCHNCGRDAYAILAYKYNMQRQPRIRHLCAGCYNLVINTQQITHASATGTGTYNLWVADETELEEASDA